MPLSRLIRLGNLMPRQPDPAALNLSSLRNEGDSSLKLARAATQPLWHFFVPIR